MVRAADATSDRIGAIAEVSEEEEDEEEDESESDSAIGSGSGSDGDHEEQSDDDEEAREEESEDGDEDEDEDESNSDDSADDAYRSGNAYPAVGISGAAVTRGGNAAKADAAAAGGAGAAADDGASALARFSDLLRPWRAVSPLCKGTAVFAIGCTMNHSCEPNVQLCYARGDFAGALVAQRRIAPGDELCINYVGLAQPVEKRRKALRHYGFECACSRCVREASDGTGE